MLLSQDLSKYTTACSLKSSSLNLSYYLLNYLLYTAQKKKLSHMSTLLETLLLGGQKHFKPLCVEQKTEIWYMSKLKS